MQIQTKKTQFQDVLNVFGSVVSEPYDHKPFYSDSIYASLDCSFFFVK